MQVEGGYGVLVVHVTLLFLWCATQWYMCVCTKWPRNGSALCWRPGTCFCPFVVVLITFFVVNTISCFVKVNLLLITLEGMRLSSNATKTKWLPHSLYCHRTMVSEKNWSSQSIRHFLRFRFRNNSKLWIIPRQILRGTKIIVMVR